VVASVKHQRKGSPVGSGDGGFQAGFEKTEGGRFFVSVAATYGRPAADSVAGCRGLHSLGRSDALCEA